jgi:LysR family transcriptional regulator, glycine cleavage system transcriptional activator
MLTSMPDTSRLPLHVLPTFRTVARLANMRAAAEELHLTHSAVSQQIQLLEEQLGFAVFDRRGRRIALNAAGEALLQSVEPALDQLDDGMRAAAAAASGTKHRIRVTLLPSFAQRWLLPRISTWRERNPHIGIELHSSQQVVDLQREGFHAALRQGGGEWRGLASEQLIDSPLIVVGSPNAARRLLGRDVRALADEPLLGSPALWARWFELNGLRVRVNPVAAFNDAGLMLQAAEQDMGVTLARELFAADALCDGRLVRLSPLSMPDQDAYAFWLVYPPALRSWPPLIALRAWLLEELAHSQAMIAGMRSDDATRHARSTPPASAKRRGGAAPSLPRPGERKRIR